MSRLSLGIVAGTVLVMFLWAVCFPLINVGLTDSPPMAFATLRAVLSGAVLLVAAQWLRRPAIKGGTVWGGIVLVGLTATSLGFFGMFYGGGLVSPGLATVVANTQPLIAAVLAWAFLNERLTVSQQCGLAAGFAGIVLIATGELSGMAPQLPGILLILLAAAGIAISNVALKRLAGRVDVLRSMGWQLIIGGVPLALLALAIEDARAINWSLRFVVTLITLSLLGTSATFVLWFSLLRRSSLNQLNVFTFLTPIFGLVMGALFFAERLHGVELAGIAVSLLGIFWVSRPARLALPATGITLVALGLAVKSPIGLSEILQ
ncbi:MAG: DMT family transporter [Woeseia sp.]